MISVVLYLLMANGSYICTPDDCKSWPVVATMDECKALIKKEEDAFREKFKSADPQPSGFLTMCIAKEDK